MFPGTHKKVKAKRSYLRVGRNVKAGEYHKVRLRRPSGGSLTIRYRKRCSISHECSGQERSSGEAEASNYHSDGNLETTSFCEYLAFENLADLPEYSQSCVSGVPGSNNVCTLYACEDLASYDFWSNLEDCNSSDIGSNEVLQTFASEFSASEPPFTNESFPAELENSSSAFELDQVQYEYCSLEKSAMLLQQLFSFTDDIEVASNLICMEAQERLTSGSWSVNEGQGNADEGQPIESLNLDLINFPPVVDRMEDSEIELIDLPPLLQHDTGGMICTQENILQPYCESAYENNTPANMDYDSTKAEAELFDEQNIFLLDPGTPEELNVAKVSNERQSPWGAFLQNMPFMKGAEAVGRLLDPSSKITNGNQLLTPDRIEGLINHDISSGPDKAFMELCSDIESVGQGSLKLPHPVASRAKKLRTKRIRRATPLHTVSCLLSSSDTITSLLDQNSDKSMKQFMDNISATENKQEHYEVANCTGSSVSKSSQIDSTLHNSPGKEAIFSRKGKVSRKTDRHNVQEIHKSLSNNTDAEEPCSCPESRKMVGRPAGRKGGRYGTNLPVDAVTKLRNWFDEHIAFPFADKQQKHRLVERTGLKLSQVENWLSNYRHKLKVKKSDYKGMVLRPEKAWTKH